KGPSKNLRLSHLPGDPFEVALRDLNETVAEHIPPPGLVLDERERGEERLNWRIPDRFIVDSSPKRLEGRGFFNLVDVIIGDLPERGEGLQGFVGFERGFR